MHKSLIAAALVLGASPLLAQGGSQEAPANVAEQTAPQAGTPAMPQVTQTASGTMVRAVPAGTLLVVTPLAEITSKRVEVGDQVAFTVVNDVVENGVVAIPRGTPVKGAIAWKTGRAIGGKSGKFEIQFKSLSLAGHDFSLRGTHRQEGRGNSVGALLGSMVISGRSAVMLPGQLVNIFTAEPITF